MFLYPKDLKEKIEFTRVVDFIIEECLSEMGQTYFREIEALTDLPRINRLLDEVDEYKKAMERGEHLPIYHFESISDDIKLLRKEGYVLEIDSIKIIYRIVSMGIELTKHFADIERAKLNPIVLEIVSNIIIDKTLTNEIDRVLDEEGDVRPNASEALMKISKQIKSKERELEKVFNDELEVYKNKGFLLDSQETLRNGRRVLTVSVEHKRKVGGIIHDESATGKTVFIEPERVITINHEVYNLYAERRHEIYKILRALCAFIRPYADGLLVIQHTLIKLDTIRAKARFAYRIDAKKPFTQEKPCFGIKTGYNPILILKNENTENEVIPFDLELHGKNRILVLSGPNAGGKSVAMKSVGLLQLMVQCGMLVPVDENSRFGIFDKLFVDIGDQQSLEDDLSTYSSHLKNMKMTTEQADKNSLVLIDEFGSGTDPKIGGSIAEAVLSQLNYQKVYGVITTHYSNLKFYAFKAHGIVNGSMEFDKNHLLPTFKMHIGKPGSSFAYEIAEKIGLDARIVDYAQNKTGKNEKAIDEMLISLMAEKKEYEDKFSSLIDKQDRLDRLIHSYEQMNMDLDIKRKKIKLQAKEQATIKAMDENNEMQKLLKEIKQSNDEGKAKKAALALREHQEKSIKELKELKQEIFAKEKKVSTIKLEVGSFAKMRNGTSTGEILSIRKGVAEIQMGFLNLQVPVEELVSANEPIEVRKQKSVQTSLIRNTDQVETRIDIREYTKSDALQMLQDFLDNALLTNAFELKIIHGVGTGVMRNEVRKMLQGYKDVKEFWNPEPEMGGEGVTIVRM
jgi:DNA mismatch repair protein MutS2